MLQQPTNAKCKLIVLVGPTASGKSELAVKLAKKFNGEIISADSRQIYKGMDLGTGKIEGKWKNKTFVYKSIPHYCIDFANPKSQYSVAKFQRDANKAITNILKRGKLPIICGGTAHWADAVIYNQAIPDVKPNLKLRKTLEKKSANELFEQLQKLDPARAATIDKNNARRLIRALEIVITTGKPVPPLHAIPSESEESLAIGQRDPSDALRMTKYDSLWLGIQTTQDDLYKKIDKRLRQRLKDGMTKEIEVLKKSGLSWKKLESFGLEYKFISLYLQNKISYDGMVEQLSFAIKHYSKRQLTWWKRNKKIHWFELNSAPKINKIIQKFLKTP